MVKRTEEWQIEVDWGLSTLLVEVHDDEAVLCSSEILPELGLTEDDGEWVADAPREKWVLRVPYSKAAERLKEAGFTRVDNSQKVS